MLLRLQDLPKGNGHYAEPRCESLRREEGSKAEEFIEEYHPKACRIAYEPIFYVPGRPTPELVESVVIQLPSNAAAEAGLEFAPELLLGAGALAKGEVPPPEIVGEASRQFNVERLSGGARPRLQDGSSLVWRSGSVLGSTYAAEAWPRKGAREESFLLGLARAQQAHIEDPTPYPAAQSDDTMVPFEDPSIDFPIYWLGRTFRTGGLPVSLRGAAVWRHQHPHEPWFTVEYDSFSLTQWTNHTWRYLLHAGAGYDNDLSAWKCTRTTRLDLPRGQAVIRSGYRENFQHCPRRPPTVFRAEVRFGRWTIEIDPGEYRHFSRSGPYNSRRALETVARGLRRR